MPLLFSKLHANKILWGRQQCIALKWAKGGKNLIVVRELSMQKLIVKKYI